jgi:hypothetical protein
MWWQSLLKALAVGFLAYFIGNVAQVLHAEGCPLQQSCISDSHPSETHIVIVTALVFVLAFGVFVLRAYRRKRILEALPHPPSNY